MSVQMRRKAMLTKKQTDKLRDHFGYVADLLDQIAAQEEQIKQLTEEVNRLRRAYDWMSKRYKAFTGR